LKPKKIENLENKVKVENVIPRNLTITIEDMKEKRWMD
jgi:hypothetical protein